MLAMFMPVMKMFKLKPKSTYAQLTLLFGLLIFVNFVIIIATLRQLTINPSAEQMASLINAQVKTLKELLTDKNQSQAEKILFKIGLSEHITLSKKPNANDFPSYKFYILLKQKLIQDRDTKVLSENSKRQSRIWVKPSWTQDYWLGFAFQPFVTKVSKFLSVLFVILLLLSLFAAYFFSRYMLKPFKNLAKMATSIIENDNQTTQISIKGTTEVKDISRIVKKSAEHIQKLNKEKELLLAGVSHDLRTPLARMRLQAEFMNDDSVRKDLIEEIDEMNHIIEDFINYVRLGSLEEFQKLNINVLIEQSIQQFCKIDNQLCIAFKKPKNAIILSIKPTSFKRMLSNIYENSFKYGKPPVEVSIQQSENKVIICVKDNGQGIDKESLKVIFDPFMIAQSHHNKFGSGLGLSIVKKLAKQNNAQVSAQNQVDSGLMIFIEFSC